MNETLKVLETRRSCRNFKPDMVKDEDLKAIVRAGTYAATGMGKQSPLIIAVTDKALRDQISDENRKIGGWDEGFDPFYGAPAMIIVLGEMENGNRVYDGSHTPLQVICGYLLGTMATFLPNLVAESL